MINSIVAQAEINRFDVPDVEWTLVFPVLIMSIAPVILVMITSILPRLADSESRGSVSLVFGFGASVLSFISVFSIWGDVTDNGDRVLIGDSLALDHYTVLMWGLIVAMAGIASLVFGSRSFSGSGVDSVVEQHVLLMLSAAGGMIMVAAQDLILLFIGLEVMSIAVYVLAALDLRRRSSQEAGFKYFLLGAVASAIFAYGIAFIYGATGSLKLDDIAAAGYNSIGLNPRFDSSLILVGIAFMLVGFGFKISAFPFHSWTPDVYEGSPTPVVAFMASAIKVAGVATLLRVLLISFEEFAVDIRPVIAVLAALSLVGGSVMALAQSSVKRMLAYSSINHVGFMLVGIYAAQSDKALAVFADSSIDEPTVLGVKSVAFYLIAYAFMAAGSFAVLTIVERLAASRDPESDVRHLESNVRHPELDSGSTLTLSGLAGLGKSQPLLAGLMGLLLFAQAGVPFTAGFWAKLQVLAAAVSEEETGGYILAALAMVTAVIAAVLYLRVVVSMFLSDENSEAIEPGVSPIRDLPVAIGIAACVAVVFVLGILPGVTAEMLEAVAAIR